MPCPTTHPPTSSQTTDQQLASMLVCNPDRGLRMLIDERFPIIIGLLRKRGMYLKPFEQDDLTADLASEVWMSIGNYRAEKGALNTWLLTIAYRIALKQRAAGAEPQSASDQIDQFCPSPAAPRSVRAQMSIESVRRIMHDGMSPATRVTLEYDLAASSGRGDTKEIQRAIGGSRNSVYLRRQRAHRKLTSLSRLHG